MPVKAIPEGYHSVTPYLIIDGAAAALDFYKKAFGATEVMRMPMGDRIGHAEIKLGDSHVMLSDEWPEMGHLSPKKRGGPSVSLMFYVENPDAVFDRAIKAGATVQKPVENQFYGDRTGTLVDPFGHIWSIGAHVEDVPMDEMKRRMESWSKEQGKPPPESNGDMAAHFWDSCRARVPSEHGRVTVCGACARRSTLQMLADVLLSHGGLIPHAPSGGTPRSTRPRPGRGSGSGRSRMGIACRERPRRQMATIIVCHVDPLDRKNL